MGKIKQKEKGGNKTVLSGVPQALPSLIKAFRIQEKAHNVGFDWDEASDSWQKVKEEILEFETEIEHMDKERAENELGDILFSLVNMARLYKINPDNALEKAIKNSSNVSIILKRSQTNKIVNWKICHWKRWIVCGIRLKVYDIVQVKTRLFNNKIAIWHFIAVLTMCVWGTTFISTKVLLQYGLSPADIFCCGSCRHM